MMIVIETEDDLREAIKVPTETESIDFKEAKTSFNLAELCEYVSAFANEGGGTIVFGVTDRPPRQFVGTNAFGNPTKLREDVFSRINWRIRTKEFHPDGRRVMVIETDAAPRGRPVMSDGRAYCRIGSQKHVMNADRLRAALQEPTLDFSAEVCKAATVSDLSADAIKLFKSRWGMRDPSVLRHQWDDAQLLEAAELTVDGAVTNAAVILLANEASLTRCIPQAETVFEFRARESDDTYAERREYREGFLLWMDDIWSRINVRNTIRQLRSGLFRQEISAFEEASMREAMLNAIAHRDYQNPASVFVRMYPSRIEFHSPGGFPSGVTAENIVDRQSPRNRRLADAMKKCGLVERSGQGADIMFRRSIETGKPLPDYSRSDNHVVVLDLRGEVTDEDFIRFLEGLSGERGEPFSTNDLRVLDMVHRGVGVPNALVSRRDALLNAGAIERVGGKNKWILSRRYREFVGDTATYEKEKGRSRTEEKAVLLDRIRSAGQEGVSRRDLLALVDRSKSHVGRLLDELRAEDLVLTKGRGAGARWVMAEN